MKIKSKTIEIISRTYLGLAAIILFAIGSIKGLVILSNIHILQLNDPVLSFLTNRDIILFSIILEYATVSIILFQNSTITKLFAVFALGLIYLWYRVGLSIFGGAYANEYPNTLAWAFINGPFNVILNSIFLYVLIGSAILLYLNIRENRLNHDIKAVEVSLLLILAGFCANGEEKTPAFSITGELQYNDTMLGIYIMRHRTIVSSGNHWLIRLYVNNNYDYTETGCDGTNTYSKLFVEKNVSEGGGAANILPFCIPIDSYQQFIWFAYASGEYLKTNISIPALWHDPFLKPEAHIYDMKVKLSTNPPYLPESAEWIVSSNKIRNLNNELKKWPVLNQIAKDLRKIWLSSKHILPEPIGFLAARYKVLSFTNVNGFYFPLEFVFEKCNYISTSTTKSNISNIETSINGIIKNIEVITNYSIYPELPKDKRVRIYDGRYSDKEGNYFYVSYYITNSWDNYDKKLVNSLYKQKLNAVEAQKVTFSKILYGLGLIIIIGALVYIWNIINPNVPVAHNKL